MELAFLKLKKYLSVLQMLKDLLHMLNVTLQILGID